MLTFEIDDQSISPLRQGIYLDALQAFSDHATIEENLRQVAKDVLFLLYRSARYTARYLGYGMGWISGTLCILIAIVFLFRQLFLKNEKKLARSKSRKAGTRHENRLITIDTAVEQPNFEQPSFTFTASDTTPSIAIEKESQIAHKNRLSPSNMKSSSDMPPPPPPSRPQFQSPTLQMPPPRSNSPPRLRPPTVGPAPPRPGGNILKPPPSAASSLRVPQQKVLQNTSMQPSSLMPPPKKSSRQVALEPGHSPLDWAALTSNPNNNLRGKDLPSQLIRVTPSQLKAQNGRRGKDAWTVYQGKVYNITPYVPFHPGGKGEILRGAAKDSVKLFMEVHPWVNWDGMLGECLVGILVGEDDDAKEPNNLDEMD